jgi:hypothetical protein
VIPNVQDVVALNTQRLLHHPGTAAGSTVRPSWLPARAASDPSAVTTS